MFACGHLSEDVPEATKGRQRAAPASGPRAARFRQHSIYILDAFVQGEIGHVEGETVAVAGAGERQDPRGQCVSGALGDLGRA